MMRNPLDRRMFMNPQQRRGMARMPQGILASGPRIMQAAAGQEPVRMAHGGYHGPATGLGMSGFTDFLNQYVLGPRTQIGGSPSTDESVGALNPAPGPDTGSSSSAVPPVVPTGDMPGAEDIPSDQPGDVNFGPESGAGDATTSVAPDASLTEQFDDLVESRPPTPPKQEGPKTVFDELKQILETTTPEGKKKKTSEHVGEAKKLLEEYGIEAPDLKSRRDLRIMEFFLNMAAGQSPYALTNIGTAAKEAFRGYGDDVREVEAAEQKLKLASLEMGMAQEARDEAAAQALLLKKYDIAADLFEKINDIPDKSQQIKVLMESYGVSQEDAIKMVYPGKTVTPQGYEIRRDDLIAQGHSPAFATYMSLGGASLLTQIGEGGLIVDSVIRAIGEDNMTQKDRDFLQPDEAPYRAGGG